MAEYVVLRIPCVHTIDSPAAITSNTTTSNINNNNNNNNNKQLRSLIEAKLSQSGEREHLKELLRLRLAECGWREELKAHCKGIPLRICYLWHACFNWEYLMRTGPPETEEQCARY
jgi:hypothetical protein